MKTFQMLLLIVVIWIGCAVTNLVDAKTWTQTSAPTKNWTGVAISAEGTTSMATPQAMLVNLNLVYDGIWISTNSGKNWALTSAPLTNWYSITASADGTKWVAVGASGVYSSLDSGKTWDYHVSSIPFYRFGSSGGISSSADGTKLVAVYLNAPAPHANTVWFSTDCGSNWLQAGVPSNYWTSVAISADGQKLIATGNGVYISTNAGSSWVSNNISFPGVPGPSYIALSADGSRLTAAKFGGGIFISTNSGADWTTANAPATNWVAVACSADGQRLVAAVNGGGIYTSMNSGADWSLTDAPMTNWVAVASSADGNMLVAAVTGGGIWTARTVPSPHVNIAPSGGNLTLSWTVPSTNFVMQQSTDLQSWTDVMNLPVLNLTNLHDEVILPLTNCNGFFRLATP